MNSGPDSMVLLQQAGGGALRDAAIAARDLTASHQVDLPIELAARTKVALPQNVAEAYRTHHVAVAAVSLVVFISLCWGSYIAYQHFMDPEGDTEVPAAVVEVQEPVAAPVPARSESAAASAAATLAAAATAAAARASEMKQDLAEDRKQSVQEVAKEAAPAAKASEPPLVPAEAALAKAKEPATAKAAAAKAKKTAPQAAGPKKLERPSATAEVAQLTGAPLEPDDSQGIPSPTSGTSKTTGGSASRKGRGRGRGVAADKPSSPKSDAWEQLK